MNRFISSAVRRGGTIVFPGNRYVLNLASDLLESDIDYLRDVLGHGIVEDVQPGARGAIESILAERQQAHESISAQLREAIASGNNRLIATLQPQSWESANLVQSALQARERTPASDVLVKTSPPTPISSSW